MQKSKFIPAIFILLLPFFTAEAIALTIYVPDNYEKIQWAIDNASDGDRIIVKSGTYQENVVINKRILLKSWNEKGRPVIDAGSNGSAIVIVSGNVTVSGFVLTNSGHLEDAGIKILSDGNLIRNNVAKNNQYGILLINSSHNTIAENTVSYNVRGMAIKNSTENRIYMNNFINNHNIFTDSVNIWNTTEPREYVYNNFRFMNFLGNYWIDYEGEDLDGNGIGDTPYAIGLFNRDVVPLMDKFENYLPPAKTPTPAPIHTKTTPAHTPPPSPLRTTETYAEETKTPEPIVTKEKSPGFEMLIAIFCFSAAYLFRRVIDGDK